MLWARAPEVVRAIAERGSARHLPDVALEPRSARGGDLVEAMAADLVLLTVPAQVLRALARELPAGDARW